VRHGQEVYYGDASRLTCCMRRVRSRHVF
jgi:hypothetical protein